MGTHQGQTEPVVQPATTKGLLILEVAGFALGEGKREGKGGDEIRVATEEAQRQGPDACFAAKQMYKTPSPRKYTFYPTGFEM